MDSPPRFSPGAIAGLGPARSKRSADPPSGCAPRPSASATAASTIAFVAASAGVVRTPQPRASERSPTHRQGHDGVGVDGEEDLVEAETVLAGGDDRTRGDRVVGVAPARHRELAVVGQVGVAPDDGVDVVSTPVTMLPKSDVGSSSMVAQSVPRGALVDAAARPRRRRSASRASASVLTAVAMSVTVMSAMPPGDTSSERCSVTAPTKPTWTPPMVLNEGRGRRPPGCPTPSSSRWRRCTPTTRHRQGWWSRLGSHHPVDQVVVALVELVVAHRGDLKTRRVQRVDGRLVVVDERLEGRRTDQVTRGGEDRVGRGRTGAA